MHARFKITSPETTSVTLTLTAEVGDWKALHKALEDVEGAETFRRQLAHLIQEMSNVIVTENWTTGYSAGKMDNGL